MASSLIGKPPNEPSHLPIQMGELVSSMHLFAAITIGVFHYYRTNETQLINLNLLRSGIYSLTTV